MIGTPSTGNPASGSASSNAPAGSRYRPEIDGLRAFAVLAVILNHCDKRLLPSGYLGVDIFFVISGYVITTSLVGRSYADARSFFLGFYARRIRRILPALAAVVLIASIAICFFDPAPGPSLLTGASSLVGFSNILLYFEATDYFSVSSDLNPFTHTWSLGVEEQFYLLFPLLVWLTGITRSRPGAWRWFGWSMALLSGASLVSFILLSRSNPSFAYFSMPTRFWEIGLGALLFAALRHPVLTQRARQLPAAPLLVAITLLLFTDFRVRTTIAVVLLTALLLACLRPGSATHRLLSLPGVRFIGLISYSLYLWHWPVLAISRWTIGIHPWTLPLQLALMGGLAVLSYRLIESPLRHAGWLKGGSRSFGFGLLLAGAAAAVPLTLMGPLGRLAFLGDVERERFQGNLAPESTLFEQDCMWWMGRGPDPAAAARNCVIQSRHGPVKHRFFVMGDSHTAHLSDWIAGVPAADGLWLRRAFAGGQSVPPIQNRWSGGLAPRAQDARRQRQYLDRTLAELRPGDTVVISTYLLQQFRTAKQRASAAFDPARTRWDVWWQDLEGAIRQAQRRGANVVFVSPLPDFALKGGWAATTNANCTVQWYRPSLPDHCFFRKERRTVLAEIAPIAQRLKALESTYPNFHVYDGLTWICPADRRDCTNYREGTRLYSDVSHLNRAGSRLLRPHFEAFLRDSGIL